MRIRSIKPEFWQSESVGRLSREARLLFIGLWSLADDSGRARAASRFLASLLYPYDEDSHKRLPGWLAELQAGGFIRLYVGDDGCHYLDIPKWLEHQKIDRPTPSKLPAYREGSPTPREDSRGLDVGTGNREQGTGKGAPPPPAGSDWSRWTPEQFAEEAAKANATRDESKRLTAEELAEFCRYWLALTKRGKPLFTTEKTFDMVGRLATCWKQIVLPNRERFAQPELSTRPDDPDADPLAGEPAMRRIMEAGFSP